MPYPNLNKEVTQMFLELIQVLIEAKQALDKHLNLHSITQIAHLS